MSETPPMPPVPSETEPSAPASGKAGKASKSAAQRPAFVFVLNELTHPVTLYWREFDMQPDDKGVEVDRAGPKAHESKILGRGFNWIPSGITAKCVAKGETFDDVWGGRVREIDPSALSQHVAVEVAKTTSSRQACVEWRKRETRDLVRKALDERLATRGPRQLSTLDE